MKKSTTCWKKLSFFSWKLSVAQLISVVEIINGMYEGITEIQTR